MKKNILLALTLLISFSYCYLPVNAQQLSFPGAEGAGSFVTGGRGTAATPSTVFIVTSLADGSTSTVGTLRWALNQTATYRTIIFRVSGTIHLNSALTILKPNTTIAGQTAPGDGICIADYTVTMAADNVIVRYMRFRLGDKNENKGMINGSGDDDAFSDNSHNHKNIIIDHCTMSWSDDESCTFYGGDSLTLQWNLISEPLNYSYHFETNDTGFEHHGYGGIWGGAHASFHHNLLAHCQGRVPRFDGCRNLGANTGTPPTSSSAGVTGLENADFRNNVLYDWGIYNNNGGEGGNYNIINNYYKSGPSTAINSSSGVNVKYEIINPYKQAASSSAWSLPYGHYYLSGNYVNGSTATTNNNWLGAAMNSGSYSDTASAKVTTPFSFTTIQTQAATDAYNIVLKSAGCILPNRDTLDQRIVSDVMNGTGRIIDVQGGYPHGTAYATTVNAWPTLNSTTPPTDTDADGMPDEWETQRGLSATNATDRNGYNANGYSNLENYLNGDSIIAVGTLNTCVSAKPVVSVNSAGWLDLKDTTYTRLVSTDTTNVMASIKDNGNYGTFNASYYTTGTTRLYGTKPYGNRNVTIIPSTTPSGPVTVRLYMTNAEFAALKAADASINTISDVRVLLAANNTCATSLTATTAGITPTATGTWGTYQTGYYLEFNTSVFGTFFFGSSSLLPLNLLSFTGVNNNGSIQLNWTTTNEVNTSAFSIERSVDAQSFTTIGVIAANNTAGVNRYSFTDNNPFNSVNYYRLLMTDKDGTGKYSDVVAINNRNVVALSITPNPVTGICTASHDPIHTGAFMRVLSTDGKQVLQPVVMQGASQTRIDASALPKGTYFLVLSNDGKTAYKTFVKM